MAVYGSLCMGQCVWVAVYGSLCMGHCVWVTVYGSLCMGRCVWVTVYGSLCMGHCLCVTVYGSLCMGHCVWVTVWVTVYGSLCMGHCVGHCMGHCVWVTVWVTGSPLCGSRFVRVYLEPYRPIRVWVVFVSRGPGLMRLPTGMVGVVFVSVVPVSQLSSVTRTIVSSSGLFFLRRRRRPLRRRHGPLRLPAPPPRRPRAGTAGWARRSRGGRPAGPGRFCVASSTLCEPVPSTCVAHALQARRRR